MSSTKKLDLVGDAVATGAGIIIVFGGALMLVAAILGGGPYLIFAPLAAALTCMGIYILFVLVRDYLRRRQPKRRSTFLNEEHLPG